MRRFALSFFFFVVLSAMVSATGDYPSSPKKSASGGQRSKSSSDIERERLEFDRQRANQDANLRERELALKEREIRVREAEQHASSWSPLMVAIIAAALGLFGNVLVTFLTGSENRKVARGKAASDEKLENLKAQSSLILEAIKAGPDTARNNLKFFVEVGLIDEPTKSRIQTWLEGHESPSLPPPMPGFNIAFTVLDSVTGKPIRNAEVLTTPAYFMNLAAVGRTNEWGVLSAQFLPGLYSVVVRAEGYLDSTERLRIPGVTELLVKLIGKESNPPNHVPI